MACSALFSAASRALSSSSRCFRRRSASSSTSGCASLFRRPAQGRLLAVELGLARDQLGLALVDVRQARQGVVCDCVPFLGLPLELLHARGELARPGRELELALVELSCPRSQLLVVSPVFGGELCLALAEHLLTCLELNPCLHQPLL